MTALPLFDPLHRLPAATEHPTGARLIRGPWRAVWPWRCTPWGRGPGRRLSADRAEQLEFDLQPAAAASAASGHYGCTRIPSRRPSSLAGDSIRPSTARSPRS